METPIDLIAFEHYFGHFFEAFNLSISIFHFHLFSINHTKDKQKNNNNNAIHYKFIIT